MNRSISTSRPGALRTSLLGQPESFRDVKRIRIMKTFVHWRASASAATVRLAIVQNDLVGTAAHRTLAPGWHHLVGVYNGRTIKLFIDGMLVAKGPAPAQFRRTWPTYHSATSPTVRPGSKGLWITSEYRTSPEATTGSRPSTRTWPTPPVSFVLAKSSECGRWMRQSDAAEHPRRRMARSERN